MSSTKSTKKLVKLTPITRATGTLMRSNTAKRNKTKAENIPNNSWDDVNSLSNFCAQLLLQATALSPVFDNKQLMAQVEDIKALDQSAHILARDLKSYTDEIKVLRARHASKSGNASTEDENMEAIDIYMQYAMFAERFEANIMPILLHMVDIIHAAEAKLRDIDNDAADTIGRQVSEELKVIKTILVDPPVSNT